MATASKGRAARARSTGHLGPAAVGVGEIPADSVDPYDLPTTGRDTPVQALLDANRNRPGTSTASRAPDYIGRKSYKPSRRACYFHRASVSLAAPSRACDGIRSVSTVLRTGPIFKKGCVADGVWLCSSVRPIQCISAVAGTRRRPPRPELHR